MEKICDSVITSHIFAFHQDLQSMSLWLSSIQGIDVAKYVDFYKEIVHKSPCSKGNALNGNIMQDRRNSIALVQLIRRFHENCQNRNRWRVVLPSLAIPKSGLEIRFALQPARRLAMAGSKLKKNIQESTRPMKYSVEWCWSNLDSTVTPSLPLPQKKNTSTSTFMWMTNLET